MINKHLPLQLRLKTTVHPVECVDLMSSFHSICVVHTLNSQGKGFQMFDAATGKPLKKKFKWTLENVPAVEGSDDE